MSLVTLISRPLICPGMYLDMGTFTDAQSNAIRRHISNWQQGVVHVACSPISTWYINSFDVQNAVCDVIPKTWSEVAPLPL